MPEISVILKVDDGNRYLQEAVNNVFMQSFSDFELLVLKEGANYEDTLDVWIQSKTNLNPHLIKSKACSLLAREHAFLSKMVFMVFVSVPECDR